MMKKKLYDVTVTSRKGRIFRYQVDGYGKASARRAAIYVKQSRKLKGRTQVFPVEEK